MRRLKSKIGPKGQAVIPKPIRDEMGWHPGDEVMFHVERRRVIVEPLPKGNPLQRLLALVPRKRRAPKHIDWDAEYYSQFEG